MNRLGRTVSNITEKQSTLNRLIVGQSKRSYTQQYHDSKQPTISEGFAHWVKQMKTNWSTKITSESSESSSPSSLNSNYGDSLTLILLSNSKYEQSLKLQQFLFDHVRNEKSKLSKLAENNVGSKRQYLIATEHRESCFTIGKLRFDETFTKNHILNNERQLAIHKIGRGGGITFHCPGQLVLYPIFDLENSSVLQRNVKWFSDEFMLRKLSVPFLQQFTNDLLEDFRNETRRNISLSVGGESEMGIYSTNSSIQSEKKRKVASIGLQLSRWVTMHGIAINIDLYEEDLHSFKSDIVACGLHHVTMTSIANELFTPTKTSQHLTLNQYSHMMDLLTSQLEKSQMKLDQIIYIDCLDSEMFDCLNTMPDTSSQSDLFKFIQSDLLKKNR